MGLRRGHRARPLEWLAERVIFVVSLSAILVIFLIFLFIGREALPVALGRINEARSQKVIAAANLDKMTESQIRQYLGLTKEQLASMDHDTLKTLMELKVESAREFSHDKDSAV